MGSESAGSPERRYWQRTQTSERKSADDSGFAWRLQCRGELDEAKNYLERAVGLLPKMVYCRWRRTLARCYVAMEDHAKALEGRRGTAIAPPSRTTGICSRV